MEEQGSYKPGLTYICVAGCGTQLTVDAVGRGPITCCGQPVRRGRVLAVAPRQASSATERPASAYRLFAAEGDFDAIVAASDRLTLVEVSAPWCGACKAMDPVLDELAAEYSPQVQLVEFDVDVSPSLPQRFGVLSVPCVLFLREGQVVGKVFGQVGKGKLVEELRRHLA